MYNRITIVGRLTADPELRQTQTGVSVASFSVAVNRSYAPRGGERQADFFNVVAWRQTAEFISKYFAKGNVILVEGTMESRSYTDKNGQNQRVWELIASNAHFVESKASSGSSAGRAMDLPPEPPVTNNDSGTGLAAFSSGSVENFTEIDDDDGDLPF